jgi:hypothetical protein
VQVIPLDQGVCQSAGKYIECGGEPLRGFVPGRILLYTGVENRIEDKTTGCTESKPNISLWIVHRFFSCGEEQDAVHRNLFDFIEY